MKVRSTAVLVALAASLPVAVVVLAGPVSTVVAVTYHDYLGNGAPEARTVSPSTRSRSQPGTSRGCRLRPFGSAVAAENYGPEYVSRGYPTVWGLGRTEEDGRFLTDTEWPAIIGEAGFLGAAGVCGGAGRDLPGRRAALGDGTDADHPMGRPDVGGLAGGGARPVSVATVTFTGPPVYGLLLGLAGVVAALSDPVHRDAAPVTAGRRPSRRSRFRVSRTRSACCSRRSQRSRRGR